MKELPEGERYIKWRCGYCMSEQKSDKYERHNMDQCHCRKSAVDAERWYSRFIGDKIEIWDEESKTYILEQ